jgi:hypothetical protein
MLAWARTPPGRAPMSLKFFLPQDVVDSWIAADRVELSGEVMTFRTQQVVLRLVPGYFFDRVSGGSDEGHDLLGRAKTKAAVLALGAEVYMNSMILGETAYDVTLGFIAKPLSPESTRRTVLAAFAEAGL